MRTIPISKGLIMLTFIYDTFVVITGIMLVMVTWYVVGLILMTCFDAFSFVRKATKADSSFPKALFAVLVVIPACHLYNTIVNRAYFGD